MFWKLSLLMSKSEDLTCVLSKVMQSLNTCLTLYEAVQSGGKYGLNPFIPQKNNTISTNSLFFNLPLVWYNIKQVESNIC